MMHHTYPDRASWLASRRESGTYRIGASEVAAVLGLSPYTDPWDIWARWHLPAVEAQESSAMTRGNVLEPLILAPLVAQGLWTPQTAVFWQDATPWLRATPDGIWPIAPTNDLFSLVEVKTDGNPGCLDAWPASGEIGEWTDDETPPIRPDYWLQVQAQLYCTGATAAELRVLLLPPYGVPDLRTYRITASPRWPAILDALTAWRERHLVGGEPPPARTREQAEAVARWRYPAPSVQREATADEAAWIAVVVEQQAAAKAATAAADEAKRLIAESRGDAQTIYAPGVGRYTVTKNGVRVTPWSKA